MSTLSSGYNSALAENRPLIVYTVWHPASDMSHRMAEALFTSLCADPRYPAQRGLGIPMRFWTTSSPYEVPPPVPCDEADLTVVIVLGDAHMAADPLWRKYAAGLARHTSEGIVLPVALSSVEDLPSDLTALRAIVPTGRTEQERTRDLLNRVMHSIASHLGGTPDPVKVFISHTRHDDSGIARDVRRHLGEVAFLDDFFDAADVPDGGQLADIITEAAGNARALLAIQTDSYAAREWCRLEVLQAKRHRVPIVVLTAVQMGEARSFPYLGNVPVIRWNGTRSLNGLVGALLVEVLRSRYFPLRVQALCRLHSLDPDRHVFSHPPELLTALMYRMEAPGPGSRSRPYLYPDPPLGPEELDLIHALDPDLLPVTPTALWAAT